MSKICNLAEEFLVEEEFLSEELNKFYTTNDINEFCCIKHVDGDDYLSILKNKYINMNSLTKRYFIKIAQEYAFNKIILHNVPDSVYTFTINGNNITTFKKITNFPELNDYILDIKKINFRNNLLNDKIELIKIDENNYIDLTKIDQARISYQKGIFNDDDVIHYSLYGYKYDKLNQTFKKQNTKYKYFINTTKLFLNSPTKFITIYAETIDKTKSGNIYFYLDGIMVNNICIKSENNEYIRINFDKIHNYLIKPSGIEEKYLTEKINLETLNISRINDVQIASSNVKLSDIVVSYFQTYNMKYMNQIFCD